MRPHRAAGPPVRIVHLGLGNFFRAHQAWYTGAAPDSAQWGIAAFTGRSRALADRLADQDGLYTLLVRGPDRDEVTVQTAVSAAHPGTDLDSWCAYLAKPEVAVVTLTVTEAAYRRQRDGGLDLDDPDVRADLDAVRRGGRVSTVPGRLVAGLAARRLAGAGPLAVVSCDNLPGNGEATARVVHDLAASAEPALGEWIAGSVSFVTTMVDRITPRTTPDDVRAVAELTGHEDAVPVVTEPFTEWVLSGDFPAGRPAWDAAGARFTDDVTPHETRKLLLLNGGHSLLAYAGGARGHDTITAAVADPVCRRWLDQWWDEAARHVPLPAVDLAAYRAALIERFTNPRIRHTLAQIAADGSQKLPIRVLPVLRGERAAGRTAPGATRVLAAWIQHLRGIGAPVNDAGAGPYLERAGSARDVLALLAPDLSGDTGLIHAIDEAGADLSQRSVAH
ncbi:mannitol dehydrogenase family protein [Micromonospora sp. WMMD812]|uniref:mannitol dehydrogenase family protein n=1 Tax=Micromonospora sp. WMMD812 TaxID=3015152 RepID=UPI00248B66BB|nr:mannitol dehydrogenase family protein [Micromonospora sp. WMMD812]WBB67716.1 mannitol dehydrogenase family protein [Micromonospora sp. WMMD812]